jgi:hypothetical protein
MPKNALGIRRVGGPFAYPAGARPGLDPKHVAVQGGVCRLSAVAINGVLTDLFSFTKGAIAGGTPTRAFDPNMAEIVSYVGASDQTTIGNRSTIVDTNFTLATIASLNLFGVPTMLLLSSSGNPNVQWFNDGSGSGTINGAFHNGAGTVTQNVGTVTLTSGVPYFLAWSQNGASTLNAISVNLTNGEISTFTTSTGLANSTGGAATWIFGSVASLGSGIKIAASMASNVFMSMQQLKAWAADPWSFWYPNDDPFTYATIGSVIAVAADPVAYGNPIFRVRRERWGW